MLGLALALVLSFLFTATLAPARADAGPLWSGIHVPEGPDYKPGPVAQADDLWWWEQLGAKDPRYQQAVTEFTGQSNPNWTPQSTSEFAKQLADEMADDVQSFTKSRPDLASELQQSRVGPIRDNWLKLRTRLGVLPTLSETTAARALVLTAKGAGVVGAAAVTFEIGTGIGTKLYEWLLAPPQGASPPEVGYQWFCVIWSAETTSCGSSSNGFAPNPLQWTVSEQRPGYQLGYFWHRYWVNTSYVPEVAEDACIYGHRDSEPSGVSRLMESQGGTGICGGGHPSYTGILNVADLKPGSQPETTDPGADSGPRIQLDFPADPSAAVNAGLEDVLEAPDMAPMREFIDWWVNHFSAPAAVDDHPGSDLVITPEDDPDASPVTGGTLSGQVKVPNCRGLQVWQCQAAFSGRGWTGTLQVQTRTFTGADVTLPADAVVTQSVNANASIPADGSVIVIRNPAAIPVAMPAYVGQPLPATPSVRITEVVTRPDADPAYGPNVVTEQTPAPGTLVVPASYTGPAIDGAPAVVLERNPDTQTSPGTDTPHPGPDAIPQLDLSPLSQAVNCNVFPFGVPCYVVAAVGGLGGAAHCPSFTFPLVGWSDVTADFCSAPVQGIVDVVRPVMLLSLVVGLALVFFGFAYGRGGGGAED